MSQPVLPLSDRRTPKLPPVSLPDHGGRTRRLFARPVVRPVLAGAAALIGMAALTGSDGIAFVVAVLLSALVVNYLLASSEVRSAGLRVVLPPSGRVGEQMIWTVSRANTNNKRTTLFVGADARQRVAVEHPKPSSLPVVLDRRGVYTVARLRITSPGPLWFPLHAAQLLHLNLASPISVSPKRTERSDVLESVISSIRSGDGEHVSVAGRSAGQLDHLRAYQIGDPIRMVHWPASAKSGSLHVREVERVGGIESFIVVIDFLDGSLRGEEMLREAAWLCDRLIERGAPLMVISGDEDRVHSSRVASTQHLDVILAEAGSIDPTAVHIGSPRTPTLRVVNGSWTIGDQSIAIAGRSTLSNPSLEMNDFGVSR